MDKVPTCEVHRLKMELGNKRKGESVCMLERCGKEREREVDSDSTWVLEGIGAFESQKSRSET